MSDRDEIVLTSHVHLSAIRNAENRTRRGVSEKEAGGREDGIMRRDRASVMSRRALGPRPR